MRELALEWNMQIQKSIHTNPPVPPFTHESAVLKVRLAEDAWNSRDPYFGGKERDGFCSQ